MFRRRFDWPIFYFQKNKKYQRVHGFLSNYDTFQGQNKYIKVQWRDPCSHRQDTTTLGGGPARDGLGLTWWREHSPGSLTPRAAAASGASRAGSGASKGPQSGGASQECSTARPKNACPRPVDAAPPRKSPTANGVERQYPEQRPRHWRGSMRSRRGPPVAAIRAPRWCQDEWGKRRPGGSNPRGPLRGGPEGQPMIRSETLEAVCVEAPKVSQGTTDAAQDILATVQRWRRRNGEASEKQKTNRRHGG